MGIKAEYVALAGMAQHHLKLADPIGIVDRNRGERYSGSSPGNSASKRFSIACLQGAIKPTYDIGEYEDLLGPRNEWQDRRWFCRMRRPPKQPRQKRTPRMILIVSPACPSETLVCRNTCGAG
jgi:hypothetical protein